MIRHHYIHNLYLVSYLQPIVLTDRNVIVMVDKDIILDNIAFQWNRNPMSTHSDSLDHKLS